MSIRIALGVLSLLIVSISGIWTSLLMMRIVDDVNGTRPREQQIVVYGWLPGKQFEIIEAYRKAVPSGRKHIQLVSVGAIGLLALLAAGACLGILPGTALTSRPN